MYSLLIPTDADTLPNNFEFILDSLHPVMLYETFLLFLFNIVKMFPSKTLACLELGMLVHTNL